LTNRHVVEQSFGEKFERETFDPVLVSFDHTFTKETYTADVLAVSYQYDLALIKIRESRQWKALPVVNF
jgi:S1-C subfamily serine protease